MSDDYATRVEAIHRALGIPSDYATSRNLPLQPEAPAGDLRAVGLNPKNREMTLVAPAAAAWEKLPRAAIADRIALLPWSGFRSLARQEEIIRRKLATGQPLSGILQWVAAPGYSEHHGGRAIDLGTPGDPPLEESFATTLAFDWLTLRAGQFGFILSYPKDNRHGITYEPWHWCWRR